MENKDFVKQLFAGVFFIVCVAMIVGAVFTIGAERGLTEPRFEMRVLYQRVGGLSTGAPVTLSGVHVGKVADIGFLDEEVEGRGVVVTLSLFKKFEKQLRKSTDFSVITQGVLGAKIINITTEPNFYRENLAQPIIGEDPLDVENLAETFGEAALSLSETSKAFSVINEEMQRISSTTQRLLNRIEQRIIDGNLFKVF